MQARDKISMHLTGLQLKTRKFQHLKLLKKKSQAMPKQIMLIQNK
jgi:hypothetical protein